MHAALVQSHDYCSNDEVSFVQGRLFVLSWLVLISSMLFHQGKKTGICTCKILQFTTNCRCFWQCPRVAR